MATEQDLQLYKTSVAYAPHLCGACSTQVSRTSNTSSAETENKVPQAATENKDFPSVQPSNSKQVPNGTQSFMRCRVCGRILPPQAFYQRKNGMHEKLCIECRTEHVRMRRLYGKKRIDYPVITEVTDPTARLKLILHAKAVVRESMKRRHERLEKEALDNESSDI